MDQMEIGNCQVCGRMCVPVERKVYYYPIKCQCHRGHHFVVRYHCLDCKDPGEPMETKIIFKTEDLQDYEKFKKLFVGN